MIGQDNDLALATLLDVKEFQDLASSFTRLTGIAIAIVDLEGNIIVASGWQRICTEFHRKHPGTKRRCRGSDTVLANQISRGQLYNVYECKNRLVDVAVPIIIDGFHLGNAITGQFFFTLPANPSA
jgi:ligand-binding sensor protein